MIKQILATATFRQSQVTIISTILNGGLGALFYLIAARNLGPADFGILSLSIVIITLVSDMADIGTNTGLVRFISQNLVRSEEKAYKFLKLSLIIKLVVWALTLTLILTFASAIAEFIFKKPELTMPLRLVAVGTGGALLFSFATSTLQAFQKFSLWGIVNIITNSIRLGLILLLSYLMTVNVTNVLISYIVLPFFGFFLTLFLIPAKKIFQAKNESSVLKELFSYNIYVAIFSAIAAISARLDSFLVAALVSTKELGFYGLASQLVQVVPQLVSALGIVAAPKFSSFKNKVEMLTYFKKLQLFVGVLSLIGLLIIPVAGYLIPILYGREYQQAVLPFILMFIAMLIFLFSIPLHISIIFYFARPNIFVWVSLGHLLIIGGLGYLLISNFGIIGAAGTVLVGTLFNFIAPLFWFIYKLKR